MLLLLSLELDLKDSLDLISSSSTFSVRRNLSILISGWNFFVGVFSIGEWIEFKYSYLSSLISVGLILIYS